MTHHSLSKSRIAAYEQCSRKLWLATHRPELAQEDVGAQARYASGHAVGEEACRQSAGGVMVEAEPNLAAAVRTTAELLASGHDAPIYEATFVHDDVLVRCDILEPRGDGRWHMAEVKSSTKAKPEQMADLATQIWVAQGAGLPIGSAAVRHLDPQFRLSENGRLDGLFMDSEILADVAPIMAGRSALVSDIRAMLAGDMPDQAMGVHCNSPYACAFQAHCAAIRPPAPEWPVDLLPRGGGKALMQRGHDDLTQVPPDLLTNALHRRIQSVTICGEPWHDAAAARAAMADWAYPRIWLDFETVSEAIPRWTGCGPWRQVPFQFSAHVEGADGRVDHVEFLQMDGTDPRRACALALLDLPGDGAVIAWYASFEKARIRELAADFPNLAPGLHALAARVVDLLPVARDHWYHRDQRGSWSIKAVLPTIAPQMSYLALEVKDGGQAQQAYWEAIAPDTMPARRALLEQGLRRYCARDTEAMMVVARALAGEGA
ncbi:MULTISPECIES: DUF2779 domain-containing protein [Sphingobium]|jgi:CRISPR/Cas system-associated exonuclease Cas4 (RecB family)|uniref:DUF2779 domain-containing protein n=1 Tax=Sphingobium TaxID=165695 RepID=UPI000DBB511C|nr:MULTISPECIES: DUF2779 domain-containing protein [Sphingobium]KAA9011370.1 DUF2779 domain-containing protein [Sphingobium limneticum]MBU0932623.1 DUF2779 domain-containing protein [Alphaproteobacteria bacterium]BBD02250.1 hypothetical protein YGS_C2P0263 [Sphingobium sp. YG1]